MIDILGSLDDKIENNELQIQKTNELIEKLFRKNISDVEYRTLGELCLTITKGTTPTTLKRSFVATGIPFIKVESLTESHQIDISKVAYIDEETHNLLQRSQLKQGDLLLSIAGTIGRFALLPDTIKIANTNQAVAILRGEKVSQQYLYALFISGYCDEQIKAKTVQAVQANLSLSVIASLSVPLITDEKFHSALNCLCDRIDYMGKEILKLNELKQLYLKKFFG